MKSVCVRLNDYGSHKNRFLENLFSLDAFRLIQGLGIMITQLKDEQYGIAYI